MRYIQVIDVLCYFAIASSNQLYYIVNLFWLVATNRHLTSELTNIHIHHPRAHVYMDHGVDAVFSYSECLLTSAT